MALLLSGTIYTAIQFFGQTVPLRFGRVIHETRSEYSHIRIREKGTVRSLLFVDEAGKEQCQSSVDLDDPGENQLAYTRSLFASFLLCHPQHRVLIVGLGGGGMVRFLNRTFPEMKVEAVEIDPVVVALAAEYFKTVEGPNTVIHTADAFHFFDAEYGTYDAIYLDAFLRATPGSGQQEKTARLKTEEFLKQVRVSLSPGGVVAFNLLSSDEKTPGDIELIRRVFPSTLLFTVPTSGNLVLIASAGAHEPGVEELRRRAIELDELLPVGISFQELVENLKP